MFKLKTVCFTSFVKQKSTMQLTELPFDLPNQEETELIYRELGLESDRLSNNLKLLKEWLKCEEHLPNDIDENLLKSFLRCCKGNLEKAKTKLEGFLVAKTKMTYFYDDLRMKEFEYSYHRSCFISNKLTPQGNRVFVFRPHTTDITNFSMTELNRYGLLLFNLLLYTDTVAGYDFVYDVKNLTIQHLAISNLNYFKNFTQLLYVIIPFRTRSIHIVHMNHACEVFLSMAKMFMSKKLRERIYQRGAEDLVKIFPRECLPNDYGGTEVSIDEKGEMYKKLLMDNREWCEWVEQLKLVGPIPEKKKSMYSFDDNSMEGSFRKLLVD